LENTGFLNSQEPVPVNHDEIHDTGEARRFLAQGLLLQRVSAPVQSTVEPALRWTLEVISAGEPLPPVGVVADIGHLLFRSGYEQRAGTMGHGTPEIPGWPSGLARRYEDIALGKLDADGSIARASDALSRYHGRDRDRGLAFVLDQLRRRAGFSGVLLNPAVVKSALEVPAEELLAMGWESLARDGLMPLLPRLYEGLITAIREMHDALGPEDVFELEHGTALAPFGQRVALRQVLQVAAEFESTVILERPRASARRHDVASRILDEDTYPVGGYSSISTRGSIESLLHSQLAYMEDGERPDLFDIKFVRDELLYYARDENQFFRRRRTFVFALYPDLAFARVKDVELPQQRIVLAIGLLVALVRRLTGWLSEEAIVFEFLFVRQGKAEPLSAERELLESVLRDWIANGTAMTEAIAEDELAPRCLARARRSLCHLLVIATTDHLVETQAAPVARLRLDQPRTAIALGDEPATTAGAESDDVLSAWRSVLEWLLPLWA
jgi:hypothetical protein